MSVTMLSFTFDLICTFTPFKKKVSSARDFLLILSKDQLWFYCSDVVFVRFLFSVSAPIFYFFFMISFLLSSLILFFLGSSLFLPLTSWVEVNFLDLVPSFLIGNKCALRLYNPKHHFSYISWLWNSFLSHLHNRSTNSQ